MLGELEHFEGHRDFGNHRCIKVAEVKGAICKMRRGQETGGFLEEHR